MVDMKREAGEVCVLAQFLRRFASMEVGGGVSTADGDTSQFEGNFASPIALLLVDADAFRLLLLIDAP